MNKLKLGVIFTFLFSLTLLVSCTKEDDSSSTGCRDNCGKLIHVQYFKKSREILLIIESECGDQLSERLVIDEKDLGLDEGHTYFLNNFKIKEFYCMD